MKIRDVIVRSKGSLLRAKSRTVLTTVGIAVGAFSMTTALAMGQGGGEYAQRIITTNTDAHSLWVMKKQDDKGTANRPSQYTGTPTVKFNKISVQPIDQYDIDKISAVTGVNAAQPVFNIDSAYVTRPGQQNYQANLTVARIGVDQVYAAGNGDNLGPTEAILPDGYRDALGFPDAASAVGQTISVTAINLNDPKQERTFVYKVKGVTRQSSMSLALAPTSILVSQAAAKELNDFVVEGTVAQNKFIAANAQIDKDVSLDDVKQAITDLGYLAQTPGDVYGALYQFVSVLQLVLFGFGVMAVITAIFGIVNTQYISVLERVQEVGLMKALGMNRRDVGRLFQLEAGLIGLVGSTIGAVSASILGILCDPLINMWLVLDPGTVLIKATWTGAIGVIVALTVTAVIAGLFPARSAADLDPIDALRSDKL